MPRSNNPGYIESPWSSLGDSIADIIMAVHQKKIARQEEAFKGADTAWEAAQVSRDLTDYNKAIAALTPDQLTHYQKRTGRTMPSAEGPKTLTPSPVDWQSLTSEGGPQGVPAPSTQLPGPPMPMVQAPFPTPPAPVPTGQVGQVNSQGNVQAAPTSVNVTAKAPPFPMDLPLALAPSMQGVAQQAPATPQNAPWGTASFTPGVAGTPAPWPTEKGKQETAFGYARQRGETNILPGMGGTSEERAAEEKRVRTAQRVDQVNTVLRAGQGQEEAVARAVGLPPGMIPPPTPVTKHEAVPLGVIFDNWDVPAVLGGKLITMWRAGEDLGPILSLLPKKPKTATSQPVTLTEIKSFYEMYSPVAPEEVQKFKASNGAWTPNRIPVLTKTNQLDEGVFNLAFKLSTAAGSGDPMAYMKAVINPNTPEAGPLLEAAGRGMLRDQAFKDWGDGLTKIKTSATLAKQVGKSTQAKNLEEQYNAQVTEGLARFFPEMAITPTGPGIFKRLLNKLLGTGQDVTGFLTHGKKGTPRPAKKPGETFNPLAE